VVLVTVTFKTTAVAVEGITNDGPEGSGKVPVTVMVLVENELIVPGPPTLHWLAEA
jgi:L,D-peptidoglycan transpeptidase YkuD (ErfK/YbiS/YcfS/YnhG family)